jgi:hypothetical protein
MSRLDYQLARKLAGEDAAIHAAEPVNPGL